MQTAVDEVFQGWTITNCGVDMDPGIRDTYKGKENVLVTHPLTRETPCVLTTAIDIPNDKNTMLKVLVSHHDLGDWELIIRVNGSIQKQIIVSKNTVNEDGWIEVNFDLSPFSGNNNVKIDLENKANNWRFEAGYWKDLKIDIT